MPLPIAEITSVSAANLFQATAPQLDLTNAAYILFSGLAVSGSYIALKYGKKALETMGKESGPIVTGLIHKLSDDMQRKYGLNDYSASGREKVVTKMVSDWILEGRDDQTVAQGIATLSLLEEPFDHRRLLLEFFDPEKIAKEAFQARGSKKVFGRALEHGATISTLARGGVTAEDRDKMLAALCLHLPVPGSTLSMEYASLMQTLQELSARPIQGIRLLKKSPGLPPGSTSKPGIQAILNDEPVSSCYKIQQMVSVEPKPAEMTAPGVSAIEKTPIDEVLVEPGIDDAAIAAKGAEALERAIERTADKELPGDR